MLWQLGQPTGATTPASGIPADLSLQQQISQRHRQGVIAAASGIIEPRNVVASLSALDHTEKLVLVKDELNLWEGRG